MKVDKLILEVVESNRLAQKSRRNLCFGERLNISLQNQVWDTEEWFLLWIRYESKGEDRRRTSNFAVFLLSCMKKRKLKVWTSKVKFVVFKLGVWKQRLVMLSCVLCPAWSIFTPVGVLTIFYYFCWSGAIDVVKGLWSSSLECSGM